MTTQLNAGNVHQAHGGHNAAVRRGGIAAVILAVLSVAEFIVAGQLDNPTWALVPFMVAKGLIILDVFMHVRDLKKADH